MPDALHHQKFYATFMELTLKRRNIAIDDKYPFITFWG